MPTMPFYKVKMHLRALGMLVAVVVVDTLEAVLVKPGVVVEGGATIQ
jgi:hypothetical protein